MQLLLFSITDGDVFVYLPKEKILITGDSLHGGTPFMAKYADKFDPAFPQSVGANVAKASSVVAQR